MASNDPSGSSSVTQPAESLASNTPGFFPLHHAMQSIIWAILINLLIALIKMVGWYISRSPSVLSEALHSFGDLFNSCALLIGIKLGSKEPDRTHPYGYGLEASVWAITACVFLLVFASIAILEGYKHLVHGYEPPLFIPGFEWLDPYWFSVSILILSIMLEIVAIERASRAVLIEFDIEARGLSAIVQAFGHIHKVVGPTTRFVFYEESIALLGAVIALSAITASEFSVELGWLPPHQAHIPDAAASIVIGLMLVGMSIYLFRQNRSILTGTSASPIIEKKIRKLTEALHGVYEVKKLNTIDRGPAGMMIHLTVEVEPNMPVKDVDDLQEYIKQKIASHFANVEPEHITVEVDADESELEWGEKFNRLIETGVREEILKPREEVILRNLYDFTHATVEDVMVPRPDVELIDVATPLSEVADTMIETGHSRFPVFREDVDDIVGIVHARDVFEKVKKGELNTPLSDIVRGVDVYPENKPVSDLLEDFKRKKIQMAAVADEHGGFAGIVTIEDLMEEIVGDIWDEHDDADEYILDVVEPHRVVVSGKYDIEDINKELGLNFPCDEFKTIGGFVFGKLGREPEEGDSVSFEDLHLSVTHVDGRRIETVTIESPVPFSLVPPNGNGNDVPNHRQNGHS